MGVTLSDDLVYDEELDPLGTRSITSRTPGFGLDATALGASVPPGDFKSFFWMLGREGPVHIVFAHCRAAFQAADTELRPAPGSDEAKVLGEDESSLPGATSQFGFAGRVEPRGTAADPGDCPTPDDG